MSKMMKYFAIIISLLMTLTQSAVADYVGQLETTKYFDAATQTLIATRGAGGLQQNDVIGYFIQFTPVNNGGYVAGGGYVTDYIPSGTQVVDASFVSINSDGSYTNVAPPSPAAMYADMVPYYTDTGIFYSTDSRTQVQICTT